MSKCSLLVISHEFPPLGGGAGRNLMNVCRVLHDRGHRIKLVTCRPPDGERVSVPFGVRYLRSARNEWFETNILSMTMFVVAALRYLWREQASEYDVVLSNMAIPAGIAGAVLSRRLKRRHVVWHHGSDVHGRSRGGAGWLQRKMLSFVWRRTEMCCFVSQSLAQRALSYWALPAWSIVPVAVAAETTTASGRTVGHAGYVLFLARMEQVKNPLLLLDAILILRSKGVALPKVKMVGSGKLAGEVVGRIAQSRLGDTVSLEPGVDSVGVRQLLAGASLIVLSSEVEGLNTTVIEAGAAGVPAVASDVPGIHDFVEHEVNGLLFTPGSAQGLAAALERLCSDSELRRRLGRAAQSKALKYGVEAAADAMEEAVAGGGHPCHGES